MSLDLASLRRPAHAGAVMGAFQSAASLARVVGPVAAGLPLRPRDPPAPFWLAARCSVPGRRARPARCPAGRREPRARRPARWPRPGLMESARWTSPSCPALNASPQRGGALLLVRGPPARPPGEIAAHRRTMLAAFAVSTPVPRALRGPQGLAELREHDLPRRGAGEVACTWCCSRPTWCSRRPCRSSAIALITLAVRDRRATHRRLARVAWPDLDVRFGDGRADLSAALPPESRRALRRLHSGRIRFDFEEMRTLARTCGSDGRLLIPPRRRSRPGCEGRRRRDSASRRFARSA